jgi:hypothetical protein
MSPGASGGNGRAWRSTVGGRSVSRTVAAVQGASLRTFPLVRPARLLSLDNPFEALLAGPPSLEVLGETAARVGGGESANPRGRRSPQSAPRPGPGSPTAPAASTTSSLNDLPSLATRSATAGSRPAVASRSTAPARAADLGTAQPAGADNGGSVNARGAGSDRAATTAYSRATGAPLPDHPAPASGALAATLDRISASALAAAARQDSGRERASSATAASGPAEGSEVTGEPDATGSRPSGGQPTLPGPPGLAGLPGLPAASASTSSTSSTSSAPDPLAAAFGGGALGELVARWQQSEQLPELAPMTASRSPFAPLATAATTGYADPRRAPDGAGDEVSLDLVQSALDELLRREAEQHGLEGGLV